MTDGWTWEYEMSAVQGEIDDLEAEIDELRAYLVWLQATGPH